MAIQVTLIHETRLLSHKRDGCPLPQSAEGMMNAKLDLVLTGRQADRAAE